MFGEVASRAVSDCLSLRWVLDWLFVETWPVGGRGVANCRDRRSIAPLGRGKVSGGPIALLPLRMQGCLFCLRQGASSYRYVRR